MKCVSAMRGIRLVNKKFKSSCATKRLRSQKQSSFFNLQCQYKEVFERAYMETLEIGMFVAKGAVVAAGMCCCCKKHRNACNCRWPSIRSLAGHLRMSKRICPLVAGLQLRRRTRGLPSMVHRKTIAQTRGTCTGALGQTLRERSPLTLRADRPNQARGIV
jgi:hypothetical protein